MATNQKPIEEPETRVINEFERFTGRKNVQISVEPIKPGWRGTSSPDIKENYQVTFSYDDGFDIMGFKPNAETPVWDLYGRPSQVYIGKPDLHKDIGSIAQNK